ncbi:short-chain dehydrogenase [Metarhizobium album]|uniref:Short-chain dehydrogenase n=1 Tax=Metarhizobium album TaxID=2182425 RepID=A0A2U2DIH5_9HYPH|nr:SDR family oxidoreductase [Rhizobium album]PWE53109.1 short-chain dehydrogenase [Rhizobium album]
MRIDLAGKILLVTGSTQGTGARVAEVAAASGAAGITICGRNEAQGKALSAALTDTGCPTLFVAADLADPSAPEHVAATALAHFGRLDLLVNAAGATDRASILDGTVADWERLFALNARAPFFLMQAFVRHLLQRGAPGAIVNILSMNAHCGTPDLAIYAASKGALATLTKNAANAHLADRIRANGINMGWAATPAEHRMQSELLGKGADWQAHAAAGMPLKRMLTVDEVAQLALFLLSDLSGLLTGAIVDLEQAVVGAPSVARDC